MIIAYILLAAISLWGMGCSGKGFQTETYLSRPTTDSIKGLFIWAVFISHILGQTAFVSPLDMAAHRLAGGLGQLIVTLFLFYSGYGIGEAVKRKGSGYVKQFPFHRIGKTLLHFDMALVGYLVLGLLLGNTYSLRTVALSLVGWESLGNSNWYIFAILSLYGVTYLSFLCCPRRPRLAAVLVTVLTVVYMVLMRRYRFVWWYDTALCYPLGLWFSLYKPTIQRLVTKGNLQWAACLVGVGGAFAAVYALRSTWFPLELVCGPLFCLVMVLFTLKFTLNNPLLRWSGEHLFELYILQRLPMILLFHGGVAAWNRYVYVALCAAITIALSAVFSRLTKAVDTLLFRKSKKT